MAARISGRKYVGIEKDAIYFQIATGTGDLWWRLKYCFAGNEKRLLPAVYQETSLKEARVRCDKARQILMEGVDPLQQRQVEKLASAERATTPSRRSGLNGSLSDRHSGKGMPVAKLRR